MNKSKPMSTPERWRTQHGNVLVYVVIFMIGWFAFFVIKDWIFETKEARKEREKRQEVQQPHQDDLYSNPYQRE